MRSELTHPVVSILVMHINRPSLAHASLVEGSTSRPYTTQEGVCRTSIWESAVWGALGAGRPSCASRICTLHPPRPRPSEGGELPQGMRVSFSDRLHSSPLPAPSSWSTWVIYVYHPTRESLDRIQAVLVRGPARNVKDNLPDLVVCCSPPAVPSSCHRSGGVASIF